MTEPDYLPCRDCEGDGCIGPNPAEDQCKRCSGTGCEPSAAESIERVFYFGCYGDPGHRFWEPGMRAAYRAEHWVPWGMKVDGGLAPRVTRGGQEPCRRDPECAQGVAALHRKDGWTALSFWDRTGDSRGNSSSTFLLERDGATFDEMVALAADRFPQITERLTFQIVPCRRNPR